jgi:hypothetical protein
MDASDPPLLEQTPLAAQGMRRLAFNSIEEETLMTTLIPRVSMTQSWISVSQVAKIAKPTGSKL